MSANAKRAIVSLLGMLGLIFLLLGAVGNVIPTNSGITTMFVCWVTATVIALFLAPKKKNS